VASEKGAAKTREAALPPKQVERRRRADALMRLASRKDGGGGPTAAARKPGIISVEATMKTIALILTLWFATISPSRPPVLPPLPEPAPKQHAGNGQLVITDATEILLDGRPCALADVPATAVVVELAVAPDGKTLLRIGFRSRP
jgi:hypothetical protein